MDRLWAPWRLSYVATNDRPGPEDFISYAVADSDDRANLVIDRTELSVTMLNRFPYNNGHLLVAPRRAVPDLGDLTAEELLDLQRELVRMMAAMRGFMNPAGFNVGLNLGRAAGAGLPGHLHWHVVPRWHGDCNFLTTVADGRVIVQALDELWLRLRAALGLPAP